MIKDLQTEAAKVGLNPHPDKTKILTNSARVATRKMAVQDGSIDKLADDESVKYLGKRICMDGMHEKELDNRIAGAWKCFNAHRNELMNQKYTLRGRLRLFYATVTATDLYACESWTRKLEQQKRLKTTQQKMLRMFLGARRRVERAEEAADSTSESSFAPVGEDESSSAEAEVEPWGDFLQRATRQVEEQLERAKLDDWNTVWCKKTMAVGGKACAGLGTQMVACCDAVAALVTLYLWGFSCLSQTSKKDGSKTSLSS